MRRSVAGARFQIDHSHPEVEFDLVVKGTGSLTIGDRNYALKPGALVWLIPGQQHRLVRAPGLEMWVVSLRPELIDAGMIAELATPPLHMLPGHELVDLDRLLSQVAQDSDEPAVYNAGIAYLAMRTWRASRDAPTAEVRPMHPAVTRALMLLRETGAAVSLSELATAAGVTAPYLSRLLIEHTGRSFVDWRNRIRLDRFMDSFRPGGNLLKAALDAGFGSYARFHHIFSEMIGCTPSEWVQQSRDPATAHADDRAALPPADYGMPSAALVGGRQRWVRLVPLTAPAAGILFGETFLDELVSPAQNHPDVDTSSFDGLDASLAPDQRDRLIASLRQHDPGIAAELAGLIKTHDFAGTYEGIASAFGLSVSRLVDAATALTMIIWVAANRGSDPGIGQVEAVVPQVKRALGKTVARIKPGAAQDAHSALLCHFVIVYHALQGARASGDPRALDQLADAALSCGQRLFGSDLSKIELTSSGFARRSGPSATGRSGKKRPARAGQKGGTG